MQAGGNDVALALQAAHEASRVLLRLREQAGGEPDLRARADRAAQLEVAAVLAEHRPADAVLSEEAVDDRARLQADRIWIVDPLDGTREYGEPGRVDWAVHVALWERGPGLTAAAVALPARGLVLTTEDPPGGWAPAPTRQRLRVTVSRSRAVPLLTDLVALLDAELVPLGSAGAKTAAVVLGEVDAYVHTGGQHEWDSAAPVAVARAAGLHCSRLDGSPLVYNQDDVRLPDLVVCRPELAEAVLAGVRELRGRSA